MKKDPEEDSEDPKLKKCQKYLYNLYLAFPTINYLPPTLLFNQMAKRLKLIIHDDLLAKKFSNFQQPAGIVLFADQPYQWAIPFLIG